MVYCVFRVLKKILTKRTTRNLPCWLLALPFGKFGANKAISVQPGWLVIVLANTLRWFVRTQCLLKMQLNWWRKRPINAGSRACGRWRNGGNFGAWKTIKLLKYVRMRQKMKLFQPLILMPRGKLSLPDIWRQLNEPWPLQRKLVLNARYQLPVSVPSHCALMQPAAEKLDEHLQNIAINAPKMTLIHNVDVAAHSAPEVIRNALKEQLYKPVRWVDSIKFMHDQGVTRFVECGPGKVLIGLNKRIAKDAEHMAIYDPETLNKVLEQFND